MSRNDRRHLRQYLGGTGLYIALFFGATIAAVAGYMTLFPASPEPEVIPYDSPLTPPAASIEASIEPDTEPVVEPPKIADELPVQSSVELPVGTETLPQKPAPIPDPKPVAPRLVIAPLEGETIAAFSMDELLYSETLADWRTHDGLDIAADEGTQVLAACSGTVLSVAEDDLLGVTVVIDHGDGYETLYANLRAEPMVAPEQYVSAGQVIGEVGTTSLVESASAPHLHFAVTKDDLVVDPTTFLES